MDFDENSRTCHELTAQALKGLWDIEVVAEDAAKACNDDLEKLDQEYTQLENALAQLEKEIGDSASQKAKDLTQQSRQLKELLGTMHAINIAHSAIKDERLPAEPVATQMKPRPVEKRKRTAAGLAALGLGLLHKNSAASTRGVELGDGTISVAESSPLGVLALGCAAIMATNDVADRIVTADFHSSLRDELRRTAGHKREEAKALIQDSSWNVLAQDDVNTQVLSQKASLIALAMDHAHELLVKIKGHQLTQEESGTNDEIVQLQADMIKTAESLVNRLDRKKKVPTPVD